MKKIIIGLLALASLSAMANQATYLISSPTDIESKLSFSTKSSEDGICKRLGFTSAVKGSILAAGIQSKFSHCHGTTIFGIKKDCFTEYQSESLVINEDGSIEKQNYGRYVSQVTCL